MLHMNSIAIFVSNLPSITVQFQPHFYLFYVANSTQIIPQTFLSSALVYVGKFKYYSHPFTMCSKYVINFGTATVFEYSLREVVFLAANWTVCGLSLINEMDFHFHIIISHSHCLLLTTVQSRKP